MSIFRVLLALLSLLMMTTATPSLAIVAGPFAADEVTAEKTPIPVHVFKTALQEHVRNIPELKKFWLRSAEELKGQRIYLEGGLVRGLIHYLYRHVQNSGHIRDLTRIRTPSLEELSLQEWSDYDVVAPDGMEEEVLKILQTHTKHRHWDVLSHRFLEDSADVGGATIEKVLVSPWRIEDPYQAIEAYLDSRLEFVPKKFASLGQVKGNSKLALALRFLRMANNLPEAKISDDSYVHLSALVDEEWDGLGRSQDHKYWIKKAFIKYIHSCEKKLNCVLEGLYLHGLLRALAHHGYSFPQVGDLPGFPPILKVKDLDWQTFVNDHRSWPPSALVQAGLVAGADDEQKLRFVKSLYDVFGPDTHARLVIGDEVQKLNGRIKAACEKNLVPAG